MGHVKVLKVLEVLGVLEVLTVLGVLEVLGVLGVLGVLAPLDRRSVSGLLASAGSRGWRNRSGFAWKRRRQPGLQK
jgi:hypothetical protein